MRYLRTRRGHRRRSLRGVARGCRLPIRHPTDARRPLALDGGRSLQPCGRPATRSMPDCRRALCPVRPAGRVSRAHPHGKPGHVGRSGNGFRKLGLDVSTDAYDRGPESLHTSEVPGKVAQRPIGAGADATIERRGVQHGRECFALPSDPQAVVESRHGRTVPSPKGCISAAICRGLVAWVHRTPPAMHESSEASLRPLGLGFDVLHPAGPVTREAVRAQFAGLCGNGPSAERRSQDSATSRAVASVTHTDISACSTPRSVPIGRRKGGWHNVTMRGTRRPRLAIVVTITAAAITACNGSPESRHRGRQWRKRLRRCVRPEPGLAPPLHAVPTSRQRREHICRSGTASAVFRPWLSFA